MRPKQINIPEEKLSQVTEPIEKEYENPFGIHVDKKITKYQFWCSSV